MNSWSGKDRKATKSGRRSAVAIGDLVAPALRGLGIPSARLTRRVQEAWSLAADPAWQGETVPQRLVGGVLVVGVRSAALRQEITQFHRDRLLSVLKAALPDVSLVAIRFTAEAPCDLADSDVTDPSPAGDR